MPRTPSKPAAAAKRETAKATGRERPCGNSNFLVDLGAGDAHSATGGFSEVIFPAFVIDSGAPRESAPTTASDRLVLKRGVIGTLDLYAWWDKARRGKAPQRRTVQIELLAEDRATVVMTWRFRNARPVCLSYSPLRGAEGGIVIETIELAFDTVEMR